MAYNYDKLKAAVESTGAVYASPDSFDFSKVLVSFTPEQRAEAEAKDVIYHNKLKEYYRTHP